MIKKYSIFFMLIVMAISIFLIMDKNSSNSKSDSKVADSNINSIENSLEGSYVKLYDMNGQLVKSYTEKEIKAQLIDTTLYNLSEAANGEIHGYFMDQNGLVQNPYEEMKAEIKTLSKSNEFQLYVLHSLSFDSNIFVGNNITFSKPQSIIIEPNEKFESMSINFLNDEGIRASIEIGNYLGGLVIPLESLELEDSYSIHLINNKQESIYLEGGIIIYK